LSVYEHPFIYILVKLDLLGIRITGSDRVISEFSFALFNDTIFDDFSEFTWKRAIMSLFT